MKKPPLTFRKAIADLARRGKPLNVAMMSVLVVCAIALLVPRNYYLITPEVGVASEAIL